MGPTLSGIEDLLKMSYGSGESNMISFVPNVFVSTYLKATNRLSEDIKTKVETFLEAGMYSKGTNMCLLCYNIISYTLMCCLRCQASRNIFITLCTVIASYMVKPKYARYIFIKQILSLGFKVDASFCYDNVGIFALS